GINPAARLRRGETVGAGNFKGPHMGRVALMIPCFTEADAVSADVLGMHRALAARGHDVCVLAAHWEVRGPHVRHLRTAARLLDLEPAPEVLAGLADGKANLLVVGRLAPNKGHATLLEAFALYRRRHNPDSRLVIVGKADERLAVYAEALRARAAALGLCTAV